MSQASLKDEIWGPTPDYLGVYVSGLANAVTKGIAKQLMPLGVSPIEFIILGVCFRSGTTTVSQLAKVAPVDAGSVSRTVNKLFEQGMLTRRRLRGDRRVVSLGLTEEGLRLVPILIERVQEHNAMLAEGITPEERAVFIAVSERIVLNFSQKWEEGEADQGLD
ncbi:MAG: MarR family winged helix-turn-helix transcriptional regulator [Chloroflexi bacterium]|nr:MarR family winged helix-turn-helix transcriptional regulator [Chloroflexota bacterium]